MLVTTLPSSRPSSVTTPWTSAFSSSVKNFKNTNEWMILLLCVNNIRFNVKLSVIVCVRERSILSRERDLCKINDFYTGNNISKQWNCILRNICLYFLGSKRLKCVMNVMYFQYKCKFWDTERHWCRSIRFFKNQWTVRLKYFVVKSLKHLFTIIYTNFKKHR